jgi:hypothetical protein
MKQWKKIITQKDKKKWGWEKTLIGGIKFFNWMVWLNWKIALIKWEKNQNNNSRTEKK